MSTIVELDKTELLLWTILKEFESLALQQYLLHLPSLATAEKKELVHSLASRVPTDEALRDTNLFAPLEELLAAAKSSDAAQTLIVQGLLLELLGRTIYGAFVQNAAACEDTRAMCAAGLEASEANQTKIAELVSQKIGAGDEVFQAFMTSGRPVISRLEGLGDGVDEHFAKRFGLRFADLVGEFVAELIPCCVELGMDRRKLMGSLAGALMGDK
jgi:hypothetical protein